MAKRSLILAGGGLKVAFQAGVLQVWLDEAGLEFDHVDGASGGVFNLAMHCQGMSGTRIADNWRRTRLIDGIRLTPPRLETLGFARSLFTLDGYRQNVFPAWGLDWAAISQSSVDATFNVYNFTKHELEVIGPSRMNEDFLSACVALPMWFPPVEIDGQIYIDSVFVTDANVEEAIRRGSDEIWVIWSVSRLSEWNDGFIANYFQIIETSANGHFNRICRRIEQNNQQIGGGGSGEFGRRINLRILAAEVPLHYLVNFDDDRLAEAVNLGVQEGRRWCQEQGIPFTARPDPTPVPLRATPVSLEFTEEMKGFLGLGEPDYALGHDKGKLADLRALVHLTMKVADVDRFVTDPQHQAKAEGYVDCAAFGGRRPVSEGIFNLLVDLADPSRKAMHYRLFFNTAQGEPLTLVGFKKIQDEPGPDVWEDTTTLFTRVVKGHVSIDDDGTAPLEAGGILRLQLADFIHEMTTFRVEGATSAARVLGLTRFGRLFLGKLWDVYGPRIL